MSQKTFRVPRKVCPEETKGERERERERLFIDPGTIPRAVESELKGPKVVH